jgi:hypothetical protein
MILHQFYILILLLALTHPSSSHKHALLSPSLLPRGGSSITPPQTTNQQQQLDDQQDLEQKIESYNKLLKYRSDQQLLYQLRSTYLSELLASRGLPLPTVLGVSTVDGERPAERVNWDCALSTVDDPKVCIDFCQLLSLLHCSWHYTFLSIIKLLNGYLTQFNTHQRRHAFIPSTPNPTPKS